MPQHSCIEHWEYDSYEGEEWYRCTICFKIYTVEEADRLLEAEVYQ